MNLSRCAHCGAVAHYAKSVTDPHLCWSIQCSDCGIATLSYSQQEMAADTWNRTTPAYSHRNGETTAPTMPGRYWFDGTTSNKYTPSPSVLKGTTNVIEDHGKILAWLDLWDGGQYDDMALFAGRWWGPAFAPWELSSEC